MPLPRVAVIIPAFCEEQLIKAAIEGVPKSVEEIIVVDDASLDSTRASALSSHDPRLTLISHEVNQGVGAAIYTGYRAALRGKAEFFVVMAGDNQMDGADLSRLVSPLETGSCEYVKGNRLAHDRFSDMPRLRRYGTRFLAWLTSWAAGVSISDSQCGYTAISREAANSLRWDSLWPRYGYPNDLLIALVHAGFRIKETPVRPVYANERSGLRPWHLLSIVGVILRRYWLEKTAKNRKLSAPELSLRDNN